MADPQDLCCTSPYGPQEYPWPLPVPPEPCDTQKYNLRGPQVEPEASFWTYSNCIPCVVPIADLIKETDDKNSKCYFPPYPCDPDILADEIAELNELASLRDDPGALANPVPGNPQPNGQPGPPGPVLGNRRRLAISPFLQLRPQPLGAVFNRDRPDHEDVPVIRTGRELARWFESETPGLAHRHALNYLIATTNWSPPRQALVWMALDVTIYSALTAAWYYKWLTDRTDVRYRPRPIEYDYRVSVLFNRMVDSDGNGDGARRLTLDPSPGTPRHPAYPSGHSTYAGAASEILSFFFPDYTGEFNMLADNAGMARLWAGIHWRSDHEQGMKLGRCVARMVIRQLQQSCICPPVVCPVTCSTAPPPNHDRLRECAEQFRACCEEHGGGALRAAGELRAASGGASDEGLREQAQGPQEGAGGSSTAEAEEQANGPQEGAPGRSSRGESQQAQGPQEGAG